VLSATAAAGGTCAGRPCWKATKSGFAFGDKMTTNGVTKLAIRRGGPGKTKIVAKATGHPMPSLRHPWRPG